MATYQSKHTGREIDDGIDAANAALSRSGGSMTGALILSGSPNADNGAATKKYVDDEISKISLTPGLDGEDGEDGKDGISPSVSVEVIPGGHRVTITDANGTKTFDVMDGKDGADGSGGDGSGDMLKSVYDRNSSGVVDNAEMLGGKFPEEYALANHTHDGYLSVESDPTVPQWAKESTKPTYTAEEVGLGNVANERQYSENYPPPYPVTSVNGETGDVIVSGGGASGTVYSAEETPTGDTWVDGKPIYSKVITATDLARNNGQISLTNVLPTDIDAFVGIRGIFLSNLDSLYRTIPFSNFAGLTYMMTALADKSGTVKLFVGSSYSTIVECMLIVEYTKNETI